MVSSTIRTQFYITDIETELGETWFINEQPVFLQFFHCGYIPQFYPTKESEITAMKQEYVAVGEEWASFEALNQLGLPSKGRDEGRVLLDPNTTWVSLNLHIVLNPSNHLSSPWLKNSPLRHSNFEVCGKDAFTLQHSTTQQLPFD